MISAQPTLSLVIPTYRQRGLTKTSVRSALEFVADLPGETAELIVVDDGSPAGEAVEASDLPAEVLLLQHPRNLGKGPALATGIAKATADLVIATDSDLPFSMEPVPTTLEWLRSGADLVIGNRLHPESECDIRLRPVRRLSSALYSFMVRNLVGLPFADTQCGYKGYRTAVARDLFGRLETKSFAYEAEILARAINAGYSVREQPLRLINDQDSSVRLARHAPGVAADLLLIGLRTRLGRYRSRGL